VFLERADCRFLQLFVWLNTFYVGVHLGIIVNDIFIFAAAIIVRDEDDVHVI
jgi:hypothetical protein